MPRRIDHVDGVIVAVGVEVLRPRDGGGAGIGILRQKTGGGRVIVPRVHVEQAGSVQGAARERHFVEERIPRAGRHAVRPGGRQIRLPPGHVVFLSPSCSCQGAARQGVSCPPRLPRPRSSYHCFPVPATAICLSMLHYAIYLQNYCSFSCGTLIFSMECRDVAINNAIVPAAISAIICPTQSRNNNTSSGFILTTYG